MMGGEPLCTSACKQTKTIQPDVHGGGALMLNTDAGVARYVKLLALHAVLNCFSKGEHCAC
jgi:hypothetical protein